MQTINHFKRSNNFCYRKYKLLIILLLLIVNFEKTEAQSIRKDYREFTQQEMNDYVDALNILYSNGTITAFADVHEEHGITSPIHTISPSYNGEQFLPWHRFFLIDMEQRIKAAGTSYTYLSIPYWNWATDQNSGSPQFWDKGFLNKDNNFPGWNFSRFISSGALPTSSNINGTMSLTTFFINTTSKGPTSTDFSHRLEYYHDVVHGWVGGDMGFIQTSPRDPVFYLHHSMVDKLWQNWEDQSTNNQSSFPNGSTPMVHYSVSDGYPFNITSNMMIDSRNLSRPAISGTGRNLDVWYAENGKVLLDGANGSSFIAADVSAAYTYRYTAATSPGSSTFGGSMYVGDVQKDASGNVIDDNKGGFEINSNVKCNFLAGTEINFKIGFWAKNGSEVVAKIITSPNEIAPLSIINQTFITAVNKENFNPSAAINAIKVFPNPMSKTGVIQYNLKNKEYVFITLLDAKGRTIKIIENQTKEAGGYIIPINTYGLAPGIYFCRALLGKQVHTIKIVK